MIKKKEVLSFLETWCEIMSRKYGRVPALCCHLPVTHDLQSNWDKYWKSISDKRNIIDSCVDTKYPDDIATLTRMLVLHELVNSYYD